VADIIKEILKNIPEGKVSEACFEGANIVLYTKDAKFFKDNGGLIKQIVNQIKKRIELRPDPSICMELEKAKKEIEKMMPDDAGISNIIFDIQRSKVIIEAEKPGMAIGKQGDILTAIRDKCLWVPVIRRAPPIKSALIENIRAVLYEHSDYRRKFLDKVGHRIYDGWIREKKQEWVRVSVLGAGRQVGRSCLLLQTQESRVLLDCGVDVAASEKDAYPYLDAPEFNIRDLDAVIISHSHLDHCGFVPYLFKFGYRGPVYCTRPTRDVSALLLLDYVKIMRGENKKPIFDQDDIKEMVKHTITLDYEEVTDITPDLRITLYNAGHVLGSSMVHMHIGNGLHNMVYTGDMKYGKTQLLNPASTAFPRLETAIMESTYGGKDDMLPKRTDCEDELKEIIEKTVKRKGKVLIPVLGVGRAQEVMVIVENMIKEKRLKKIPVVIDGMVWDVTAIHTTYPEFLNRDLKKMIFHKDTNPFMSDIFMRVGSQKERTNVIEEMGPCLIMATSGMLMGGPSVEYLRQLGDNPKNSIVFVCYQGAGSLGRRIQRGEKEIIMSTNGTNQEVLNLKMEVHTISGLSGHSGRGELMNFIQHCNPRPSKVILIHGENSKVLNLTSSIHKRFRIETIAPRNLEAIRVK
jgi:KH/beta-lactamase-domain protein